MYNSEEKIRIVIEGIRGELSIAELCRREGIHQANYYTWSKDFMRYWDEGVLFDLHVTSWGVLRVF